MTSFPTSMFESPTQFRPSAKSELANEIWKNAAEGMPVLCQNDVQYVLDGGAILHIIPWQRGTTFAMILKTYADHINRRYWQSPMIVFDWYPEHSTKDMEHLKRDINISYPTVEFTPETQLLSKKEDFLANVDNKMRCVAYLGLFLRQHS